MSAECRRMAPARLPDTSRDSHLDRDIFFLPHPPPARGVMKTKYAHLPCLSLIQLSISLLFPLSLSLSLLPLKKFFLSLPPCFPDTLANGSCFRARRLSGETANKQSKWRPVAETKEHSAFFLRCCSGPYRGGLHV